MNLPVILTEGEDGYIVAEIPVLPGCISQGRTKEEALANIKEAAELCLESMKEEGWTLPKDIPLARLKLLPDARTPGCFRGPVHISVGVYWLSGNSHQGKPR